MLGAPRSIRFGASADYRNESNIIPFKDSQSLREAVPKLLIRKTKQLSNRSCCFFLERRISSLGIL